MSTARVEVPRPAHRKKFRIAALIVCVSIYLLGCIFGGVALGWIALHPPRRPITPTEREHVEGWASANAVTLRDVAITAEDGTILRGWFLRPSQSNGDAVILLHGVSDNRLGMYGYGKALLSQHYSVLLPDARAHGLSEGLGSYGFKEAEDIHQWVSWIESADHPRCVYGLGESMGAAELLQSLGKEPRFCAVVAESPFASFREVAYARFGRQFGTGPWLGQTIFRPAVEAGFLYLRLKYGMNMEKVWPTEAVRHTKVPILLIHGMNDTNIPPFHSEEIQAANPSDVQLWKVPGAVHTGAYAVAPDEFRQRVYGWFTSH